MRFWKKESLHPAMVTTTSGFTFCTLQCHYRCMTNGPIIPGALHARTRTKRPPDLEQTLLFSSLEELWCKLKLSCCKGHIANTFIHTYIYTHKCMYTHIIYMYIYIYICGRPPPHDRPCPFMPVPRHVLSTHGWRAPLPNSVPKFQKFFP